MAILTTNTATGTTLIGRMAEAVRREVAEFRLCMARRQVFQTTLAELRALDARERRDIGLTCSDFRRIAHEEAMKVN